jgi:hypothetical protein
MDGSPQPALYDQVVRGVAFTPSGGFSGGR